MSGSPLSVCVLATVLALQPAVPSGERAYTITVLDPGQALSVNNLGEIVGWVRLPGNRSEAVLWTNGARHLLGVGSGSYAQDINDRSEVVGNSDSTGAFRWSRSRLTLLPPLTADDCCATAYSINNRGQAVGFSTLGGEMRAIRWDGDVPVPLGVRTDLPSRGSIAWDINERGDVVGQAWRADTGAPYPFLWAQGQVADLGEPMMLEGRELHTVNNQGDAAGHVDATAIFWSRGVVTEIGSPANASDMNEHGDIVGEIGGQGFIWSHGSLTMLPGLPGAAGCAAAGVNDAGVIVGYCSLNSPPYLPLAVSWSPVRGTVRSPATSTR